MSHIKKIKESISYQYFSIAVSAALTALVYEVFVFPNKFAPSGLNGVATMVQYLLGLNVGYLTMIINIPMLIVAYFVIKGPFAQRTGFFVIVFSVFSILLRNCNDIISRIAFHAGDDTGAAILAAIAAGLSSGALYSMSVKAEGCTGGVDVVAAFIHHRKPEFDVIWVIFGLNATVAGASFFVYDFDYRSVFLCIIYCFCNSKIADFIIKGCRTAIKLEVITTHPEELAAELIQKLHHGCTVLSAEGMYSHTPRSMLICVVNRRQIVEFEKIISRYEDTFSVLSTVNGTVGKFFRHV